MFDKKFGLNRLKNDRRVEKDQNEESHIGEKKNETCEDQIRICGWTRVQKTINWNDLK